VGTLVCGNLADCADCLIGVNSMRLASILRLRLRSLFRPGAVEQELEEELRYHLERQIDEETAGGRSPHEARYAALRSVRDIEQRKEECRDMRRLNLIDNTAQDLRYAFRQLRKSPGFACAAVFVLALGVAAAVTIFGFVDAALIRPLPYRDQSRLVAVFESSPLNARSIVSYQDFADWKRLNTVFASIDAYALNGGFTLTTRTGAEQVTGTRVSAGFFRTLGVAPALGRDFRAGEDHPAAPHAVILSYAAWQKRFAGRPDVIGRSITLNGAPTTIIGVLPREFHFALYAGADFWGTLRGSDGCEQQRTCNNLIPIARLKDGVSIESASAGMGAIVRRLRKEYPDANPDFGSANLVPLRDLIIGDVRPILLALLTGAGLLLSIACVNVTALLVARSDKRQREIAVRGALGASSSRLMRQFAIEGFVLAALAGFVALLFSNWGLHSLTSLIPAARMESMPYLRGLALGPLTIGFGCTALLVASALFAAIPIARVSLIQTPEGLKEGARGYAGTAWRRAGSNLVVVEVAIAMVLMVGAGLLGKSFYLLLHLDVGFRPDHLAAVQTSWAPDRYRTDPQQVSLERQIVERISRLPGVQSVAISNAPPIDSAWGTSSFHVTGRPNRGETNEVLNRHVSSAYFTTLGARLIRGSYFRDEEDASKPSVVIVNRTLAAKYFPGENPVGKQIYWDWQPKSPMQIVGVVEDVKEGQLEGAPWSVVYVPYNQTPWAWPAVLVRSLQNESSLDSEITQAIHSIDPFVSVFEAQTMTERINQSPSAYLHRSSAWLVGGFAVIAFVLSVVGLYGVIAYSVSQRTREIGIRMALGAERSSVNQLILSEAGRLIAFGLVLGLVSSLAAATLMRTLLFAVHSWDIPTLVVVAGVLASSALLASYIPAQRAASVNPVEALRTE
jgi:macrolide transport system ATP-binding/permease protein